MSFLAHHGVKGMKWGVQRDEAVLARIAGARVRGETKEDKQRYKEYKKTTSRKERKADRREVIQQKADNLIKTALKNPDILIEVSTGPGAKTLATGKSFVEHLAAGGRFDPVFSNVSQVQLNK